MQNANPIPFQNTNILKIKYYQSCAGCYHMSIFIRPTKTGSVETRRTSTVKLRILVGFLKQEYYSTFHKYLQKKIMERSPWPLDYENYHLFALFIQLFKKSIFELFQFAYYFLDHFSDCNGIEFLNSFYNTINRFTN